MLYQNPNKAEMLVRLELILQLFQVLVKGVGSTPACASLNTGFSRGLWWTWVPLDQPVSPWHTHQAQPWGGGVRLSSSRGRTRNSASQTVLSSQTENSDPPRRPCGNSIRRLRRSPVNGLHQRREGGPPNTAFIPSHLIRRSQVGFSFLRRSISCKTFEGLCK